jgi:hypothetical protein
LAKQIGGLPDGKFINFTPGNPLTAEQRAGLDAARQQFAQQHGYGAVSTPRPAGSGQPTFGLLDVDGKEVPLMSGRTHPGPGGKRVPVPSHDRGTLAKMDGVARKAFQTVSQDHVEGQAVAAMWQSGARQATLLTDNVLCDECLVNLPNMLPPGAELKIVTPNGTYIIKSSR